MVQSQMPYQCMAKLGNVLLAARGSNIDSLSLSDGSLLSTWTCPSTPIVLNAQKQTPESKPELESKPGLEKPESSLVEITLDAEPPAKKRRISKDEDEAVPEDDGDKTKSRDVTKQPVKEGKKKQNNRSDAVASGLEAPAIITLAITGDGKHVVAVTGEDKSIRVFQNVLENGQHSLIQLSQRPMPKRPCALTLTPDSTTIISADKFGDVYSLPLIPSEKPQISPTAQLPSLLPEPVKTFTPAANEFTIHSIRNLKALENQRRQPAPIPTLPAITHSHTLLLGHVSMLTDVILASSQGRQYIITSDRDEHIRVSRGIPQTHVIEGYCLGHTDFISRLCTPSTQPQVLISGGGDEELFIWEWASGTLASKINVAAHINQVLGKEGEGFVKPAISSIQHTTISASNSDIIVVASEGVPALFVFTLIVSPHPTLQHAQTLPLPGNPLSVILRGSAEDGILVSIDNIHKSGSPAESSAKSGRREERKRRDEGDVVDSVLLFSFDGEKFGPGEGFVKAAGTVNLENEKSAVGRLENLLYNLENLRKREGDGEE